MAEIDDLNRETYEGLESVPYIQAMFGELFGEEYHERPGTGRETTINESDFMQFAYDLLKSAEYGPRPCGEVHAEVCGYSDNCSVSSEYYNDGDTSQAVYALSEALEAVED